MVIMQADYRHPEMPQAEREVRYTDERGKPFLGPNLFSAKPFLDVDGLEWKIWLDGGDEPTAGGIDLFADRRASQACIDGPIVARMKANPDVIRAPLPGLHLPANWETTQVANNSSRKQP